MLGKVDLGSLQAVLPFFGNKLIRLKMGRYQ